MAYKYDKRKPFRTDLEEYAEKWDGMAHLRRENGILEAVSYTHLDVYKRQS